MCRDVNIFRLNVSIRNRQTLSASACFGEMTKAQVVENSSVRFGSWDMWPFVTQPAALLPTTHSLFITSGSSSDSRPQGAGLLA